VKVAADDASWSCPFCQTESAQIVSAARDLPGFHWDIRAARPHQRLVGAAVSISKVTQELNRAALWTRVLGSRDDVADLVGRVAESCITSSALPAIKEELANDRQMALDCSEVLRRISQESAELETPLLDAVLDQIKTHAIVKP
jgi:glycosyltransferase A (GT-A) superfamily protein (DUF2064 family)